MLLILILVILVPMTVAARERVDTTEMCINATGTTDPKPRKNIIEKIINYFESSNKDTLTDRPKFSFIGGPHYSSDTKFGIGLLAAGLYSTDPADLTLKPSNVTLFADVTTGNYYKVGIEGLHLYKKDSRRIEYKASFSSYSTYYWGIGVDDCLCDDNKTRYRLLNIELEAKHLWGVWENIYLGPLIEFAYTSARNRSNTARWCGQPLKTYILQFGATLQFDSRDNYTSPSHGWFGEISAGYTQGIGHSFKRNFYSLGFNVCNYSRLWKSGVIASRLHGDLTFGKTPWTRMPTLGTAGTMRGYYEGQYRDKKEVDATVELRQHIFKRSGFVLFGGVGMIFPSFKNIKARQILPSYGIGYRWEFKKNTNVRVDVGFGKRCWGVDFNIGEAF